MIWLSEFLFARHPWLTITAAILFVAAIDGPLP